MKQTLKAALPLAAMVIAIGLPIAFASYLAYRQAFNAEVNLALSYATGVQHRSDGAADQIDEAINVLLVTSATEPCSDASLVLMRRIDLTSSYLQAIGHVSGDQVLCSSYGRHEPVPLGPADVVHSNGVSVRLNVQFPYALGRSFLVIERDGYAAVVHKDHATDIGSGPVNVSLAVFSTEALEVFSSRGEIKPDWLRLLGDRPMATAVQDGHVIAITRSTHRLTASIAAVPVLHLHETVYDHAARLLPFALAAGLLLSFMMLRLAQQHSAVRASALALGERVKELTLMHGAARMLLDTDRGYRDLMAQIVAKIPLAMRFPDLCAARIRYAGHEASSREWQATPWTISSRFVTDDGQEGSIDVAYRERPPGVDGEPFLAEEHALLGSVADMLAAYFKRRLAEDRVEQLAYFDRVTGLPNRVSLERRLDEAIRSAGSGRSVVVLLVNLGGFRDIVSTLGHRNGDKLLCQVAAGLGSMRTDLDLIACTGGDQFVILLTRPSDKLDVDRVAGDVLLMLGRPAQVAGVPIRLDAFIGVATYPEHGDSAAVLLQRCEVALQVAKAGHLNHLLYSAEIDHYRPDRIALLGELPEAIESGQLVLHYQPKVDLTSGRTVGIEALVRWQHPMRGLIFPDQFIPLAERTQIINPLTRWVLAEALRQCRVWRDAGFDLAVSVNLSTRNLLDTAFCDSIPEMSLAAGVPLDRLTLEITESAIMTNAEQSKRLLAGLRERGVNFSMDDFGVGQSSLTYIKDLPIQKMKIDKSFVIGFSEPRNAAIVNAAVDLGHSLGMQITAEGVEDEQTLKALRAFGCDIGQGYFFSRPLSAEKLTVWLTESPWGCPPVEDSPAE